MFHNDCQLLYEGFGGNALKQKFTIYDEFVSYILRINHNVFES